MKKSLLTLCILATSLSAFGQEKVIITLTDGSEPIEKKVWEVESITFEEDNDVVVATTPEAVDLGLSVKWASFNYGASSESETGPLIGWGELTGKNHSTDLKWYPTLEPKGDIILTSYDIAYQKWGDQWRLPSVEDFNELKEKCTWESAEVNGVKGWKVTGFNGNSIFLPNTGKRIGNADPEDTDNGYYWSGNLSKGDYNKASYMLTTSGSDYYSIDDVDRYSGLAIRAVYGEYANAVVLNKCSVTPGQYSATITSNYTGDIGHITSLTLYYSTNSDFSNAQQIHGEPSSSGSTTFELSSLTCATVYYFYVEADYNNGSKTFKSETDNFTTLPKYLEAEAIDLGLSVKWASWNMGASSVSEAGGMFGWGDGDGSITEGGSWKDSDFLQDITAYNIAGTKYDMPHNIWGGKWRLPTADECQELIDNCELEYVTSYNGSNLNGYLMKASNGNSIFLPGNGFVNLDGQDMKNKAYFWTSERTNDTNAKYAKIMQTKQSILKTEFMIRMNVRAVCDY